MHSYLNMNTLKNWTIYCGTLITIAMIVGCATSAKKLTGVQPGMSRQEVLHILGAPRSLAVHDDTTVLYYTLSEDRITEGMFIGVMRPAHIGVGNYKVTLLNDKVSSFTKTSWDDVKQ
jgi:outer membrane protein assembly factor BamE (lipoprotein component of BamABCDE complex)